MRSTVHGLVQLLALVAMTAGAFLLFGIPWALLIGGFGVLVASVVAEATAPRVAAQGER